jgi:hypothetical protein
MEPIPIYFDNIDRSALVIKPKKPFIDWLNKIDNNQRLTDIVDDTEIYLLPDFEEPQQMENWIKKNFDLIFCDQLNNWYTDEDIWPQKRTIKLFKEWFDYSLHTMIMDILDSPISKF